MTAILLPSTARTLSARPTPGDQETSPAQPGLSARVCASAVICGCGLTHVGYRFTGFPDRNWDTTPFLLDNMFYTLMRKVADGGVEWQQDWATDPDGHEVTFFRSEPYGADPQLCTLACASALPVATG
jgi:hypothetical protein